MAYSVPATHLLDRPILQGLASSSATAVHDVGYTVTSRDGKQFMYVYMQSESVATYPGAPAVWVDTTADYVVTPDCSKGAAAAVGPTGGPGGGGGMLAGVFTLYNADDNNAYMWIQTKGLVDGALVSTTVAANDVLVVGNADCFDDAQSYASSLSDVFIQPCAVAVTAAAAGTAAIVGVANIHSVASIMLV